LVNRISTQVYTPRYIADFLVDQTLGQYLSGKTVGQIQNLRCLEPACGDGIFLRAMFDCLAKFYYQERLRLIQSFNAKKRDSKQRRNLETELFLTVDFRAQIVRRHLFGIDLSAKAVLQSTEKLLALGGYEVVPNIVQGNFLIEPAKVPAVKFDQPDKDRATLQSLMPLDWQTAFSEVYAEGGFDIILGNPPYLGFNDYSGAEKAYYRRWYPEVYNLKSDLLYYFFCRPLEMAKPGAKLGYIVSRFWKEAAFARNLRKWLTQETALEKLVDLGKLQVFGDASIDTCLITLNLAKPSKENKFSYLYFGQKHIDKEQDQAVIEVGLAKQTGWLKVAQSSLGATAWKIQPSLEEELIQKVRDMSIELGEICDCKTGVQTGLDRVFLPNDALGLAGIEPELLKPALKNSQISRYMLSPSALHLIYTDKNTNAENYPNLLKYLKPYRPELEKRNRYRKAEIFPYYQLQWARERPIFEASLKLVCPYKAPFNTFALDDQQHFFSTDVIAVVPKPNCPYSPYALLALLNSKLATFYFRSYGKPVGGGQYDYYANPVKKLPVLQIAEEDKPDCDENTIKVLTDLVQSQSWQELGNKVFALTKECNSNSLLTFLGQTAMTLVGNKNRFKIMLTVIDYVIYHLYNLSGAEIDLVETNCPSY
jgi:adenine-specific DNA-methyltransferase